MASQAQQVKMINKIMDDGIRSNRNKLLAVQRILEGGILRAQSRRDTRNKIRAGKGSEYRTRDFTRDVIAKHGRGDTDSAERVPVSGSARGFKGDLRITIGSVDILVENKKTSGTEHISMKRDWLEKVEKEASDCNRIPILTFMYHNSDIYVAMQYEYFLERLIELEELKLAIVEVSA